MSRRVAILQSNYIPWKGYFDLIGMVDLFIFYDDVQYTKNDWRNRNKIKTPSGTGWLTIPTGTSSHRLISQVQLHDSEWQIRHWQTIKHCYSKAPFYRQILSYLEPIYVQKRWQTLSELNQFLIKDICRTWLNIKTLFDISEGYNLTQKKEDRVLELLEKCGATHYLSGPAAKSYLHNNNFEVRGITLEWMDYSNYPEYPQLYPPFEHAVSIIDLLFNTGSEASNYLKFNQAHA